MLSGQPGKRTLIQTCVLGIGGMVGGGIFAILGEAVTASGNATFISLGLGGLLVLITGVVYSKLTIHFEEPGGGSTFIEHIVGPHFAGMVSWFLILGYIFTISLYAYAFGAYADHLFGIGLGPNTYLSSAIIIFISLVNVVDMQLSAIAKYILSCAKGVLLAGLIVIGFFAVHPKHVLPVFEHGASSIIYGSALVFVGYEGFQLLTYRYDEIENHRKNLPRAIRYCIITVIAIYMLIAFVLTGSVEASTIAKYKETALALIAEPLFGQTGIAVVLAIAVFSTAFAVQLTVQTLARLAVRAARDKQLPHQLRDVRSGRLPIYFTGFVTAFAVCMQFFGDLHQLTIFCSTIFLLVFSVVNFIGYKYRIYQGWKNSLPLLGSVGCLGAFGVLVYHLYHFDPIALYKLGGIFSALIIVRFVYSRYYSDKA